MRRAGVPTNPARFFVARARGFTLIELVMVLVLLGVLAVYAAPKVLNTGDFSARGFHDETLGMLRYAQKTAIAHRRTVCVTPGATGVTLTIDTSVPADGTCDAVPSLPNTPRGGTGLGTSVASFKFLPLGSTDQTAAVTITIPNTADIVVEKDTGFVHD